MADVYYILIAAVLVGGVCAVLAGLLLLAERRLVNYGQCTIDINQNAKRLEVKGGQTLLASLMSQEIFIPSACGGRGTCAYCKLEISEGAGPMIPTEEALLTEQEQATNVRLSCQVKVRNDLAVVIPEELFLVKQYRGQVERIRDLTHDIKELKIRLIEPNTIEFTAGQYIQLETPAYGHVPEPVYRAYSIASPPSEKNCLELIIRLVPEGICTTWVFNILEEGDEVFLNGPYGQFGLSQSEQPMVWMAGGSGMAPLWSMVRHMQEQNIQRPCTYFFGALQKRDLFLVDELRQMEKELPNFRFVPALSEPAEQDQWNGPTGLITQVAQRDKDLADCSNNEAYLCGSEGLIKASIKMLNDKGISEDRIFYDKFT